MGACTDFVSYNLRFQHNIHTKSDYLHAYIRASIYRQVYLAAPTPSFPNRACLLGSLVADASVGSRLSDLKQQIFDAFGPKMPKADLAAGVDVLGATDKSDKASAKAGGNTGVDEDDRNNDVSSGTKGRDNDKDGGDDDGDVGDHDDNTVNDGEALAAPPIRFMRIRNSGPRAKLATAPEPDTAAGGVRKKKLQPVVGVGKRIFRDDLDLRTNAKPLLDGKKVRDYLKLG